MRIVHLCVLHPPDDARVFHRECRTLAAAGHEVVLVAPTAPVGRRDGVRTQGVPRAVPSLSGACRSLLAAYRAAASWKADAYHLHEPLLVPVGLLLKLTRPAAVVYDAHEDAPRQARSVGRNQNRPVLGLGLWLAWSALVAAAQRFLDAFVCATPAIAARFPRNRTVCVRNFPCEEDAAPLPAAVPYARRPNHVVYAGGIARTRGLHEMLAAMALLPERLGARLRLAGRFAPPELQAQAARDAAWDRTDFLGWLDRRALRRELAGARLGLLLFHPEPNHLEALPNKLFEYMAAGIPVVASDFPLWREMVGAAGCGLCVDPLDPEAIARAVQRLLERPDEAEAMGRRGARAVRDRYNWNAEKAALLELYRRLDRSAGGACGGGCGRSPFAHGRALGKPVTRK